MSKKALNLGCGPVYLKSDSIEWINTDLRPEHLVDDAVSRSWTVDQVWDFTKTIPLPDESVDFILAWHILEHIELSTSGEVVKDWYRVLKQGGRIACAVPDVWKIVDMWKSGAVDDFIGAVNVAGPYNGYQGDFHKWCYIQRSLEKKFTDAGFTVQELRSHDQAPELLEQRDKIGFAEYNAQILATK